jgi:DNA polymerase V
MFALVDCNSFYCSCERVFKPILRGRPVVVLSNNDGCVISRTDEAKALGIAMGAPLHEVKGLIAKHQVTVFSSNYALYGDMSARVMALLGQFTPELEVYSIDEAFLDLRGFEHLDLEAYGKEIVKKVYQSTGIPVSVGIASTKTLAKLANRFSKKQKESNSVCVLLESHKIEAILKDFPIADVWGIGRKHTKRLWLMNVQTAFDFTQLSRAWVHKHMTVMGLRLWEELRGKPCYGMDLEVAPKKNICTSRSFGQLIDDFESIAEAVATHSAACGEKLRRQKSVASVIMVFIATNPFKPDTPQYSNAINITLPFATNDTAQLIRWATYGLKSIFRARYWYKKVGVIVHEITPEETAQIHLFRNLEDDEKHRKMMKAMDNINHRFGRNTLKIAAQGEGTKWRLKQEHLSPCYTTRFKDILVIGMRLCK